MDIRPMLTQQPAHGGEWSVTLGDYYDTGIRAEGRWNTILGWWSNLVKSCQWAFL